MARPPTPDDEQRTAHIAVRTTDEVKAKVQAAAKADGRTVSDWLLRLIEAALRKGKKG